MFVMTDETKEEEAGQTRTEGSRARDQTGLLSQEGAGHWVDDGAAILPVTSQ